MIHFGFGITFVFLYIVAGLIFAAVIGLIAWIVIKNIKEEKSNSAQPEQTRVATVTGRRMDIRGMSDFPVGTEYFVTFEFEDGARMELHVTGSQYGVLSEGDKGTLVYRGTRYVRFDRS